MHDIPTCYIIHMCGEEDYAEYDAVYSLGSKQYSVIRGVDWKSAYEAFKSHMVSHHNARDFYLDRNFGKPLLMKYNRSTKTYDC